MPFIIFCICRKFLSSRLISDTCVPEPAAMRRFREPSMFFGIAALVGVIEQMIAIWRRTSFSLPCGSLARPGRQLGRQLVQQRRHAAHALHLPQLTQQVLEVEALALLDLAGEPLGWPRSTCRVTSSTRLQHVAHAQDPRRHALGLERLERFGFFARRRRTGSAAR